MKVALFIPCYIDQFYPEVGKASLSLLEKLGLDVEIPKGANCCGQPMANAGFELETKQLCQLFVDTYAQYDYVLMPSGSCTLHVKEHYDILKQDATVQKVRTNTYDICDFLLEHFYNELPSVSFPYKIALHTGCHSLRGLRFGHSSELHGKPKSNLELLLKNVQKYTQTPISRADECCGFGGTFAITEAAVSVKMGQDKIRDVMQGEPDFLVSNDMSCLLHLDGILRRAESSIRVKHIVEILGRKRLGRKRLGRKRLGRKRLEKEKIGKGKRLGRK